MDSAILVNANEIDNLDVLNLLISWGFSEVADYFAGKGIDLEALKLFTPDDLNRLIPDTQFGLRVKFRKKLDEWRLENAFNDGNTTTTLTDTISCTSIQSWPFIDIDSGKSCAVFTKALNLSTILDTSLPGKDIVEYYLTNKHLTKAHRNTLISLICEFWLNSSYQPNSTDYIDAANQIQKRFPSETEDTYLGTKTTRGKLTQKYYSLSQKFKESGFLKNKRTSLKRSLDQKSEDLNKDIEQDDMVFKKLTDEIEWLKNNNSPEVIVLEKWDKTFECRKIQIQNELDIFRQWPILKQKIGSTLIEIDFNKLYPNKNGLLFSKWEEYCKKIKKIYKIEIKDQKNKELLKDLEKNISEDYKNYLSLTLLNAILIPQIIHKKGKENKKKIWKPSILDAQNSFAFHVEDLKNIPSIIDKRKEESENSCCFIQPFILMVGVSISTASRFYIFFNDVLYKAESFLKAVSISFQMHYVLNIELGLPGETLKNTGQNFKMNLRLYYF